MCDRRAPFHLFRVHADEVSDDGPYNDARCDDGARAGMKISWISAITFGLGAGLAGLCGGLYAPTMSLSLIPTMGRPSSSKAL